MMVLRFFIQLKIYLILFIGVITNQTLAQNFYTVVSTQGNIRAQKAGTLRPGVVITPDDLLILSVPNSKALLIGSNAKTYEIAVNAVPLEGKHSCKSKAHEIHYPKTPQSTKNDLKDRVNTEHFKIVGETLKIPLLNDHHPVSGSNYFFISFRFANKPVSHKLSVQNNNLVLSKNQIFNYAGRTLPIDEMTNITLYHHNGTNNKSEEIATFGVTYMDLNSIIQKESYLVRAYQQAGIESKETIVNKSVSFFRDAYGTFDTTELTNLLNNIVSL